VQAAKQPQTKGILKRLDLSADRALRQAQFVCSEREAAMARDRLEGVKKVESWQGVFFHGFPLASGSQPILNLVTGPRKALYQKRTGFRLGKLQEGTFRSTGRVFGSSMARWQNTRKMAWAKAALSA
jgi:hypothetical protein